MLPRHKQPKRIRYMKKYLKEYYAKNREKLLADKREYQKNNKEQLNRYHRKYSKNNRKRVNAWKYKWIEKNIEKRRAENILWNGIRRGKIIKKPCEICQNPKSHAHHPDYSKPLKVLWLCALHHKEIHSKPFSIPNRSPTLTAKVDEKLR